MPAVAATGNADPAAANQQAGQQRADDECGHRKAPAS
jgi:hypothetical protein